MSFDYHQIATWSDCRQRALLEEAEHRRLVKQAGQAKESGPLRNLCDTTLCKLGILLARWGDSLQARNERVDIEPAPLLYEG